MAELKYKSKINKIRGFALGLIFAGMILMYIGLYFKETEWLMVTFMILGVIGIVLSTVVYFWIGMLSTRAVPVTCPSCEKQTKMLGRVDACMFCKQPLTLDKNLEGKEFDERYNSKKYQEEVTHSEGE
ncbi:YgzB family protein [Virgibacillus sp. MSP4-1]|uniref:YgzB family protein n=1 Tax=Virgibacillus sp. MSP4-1 TaxID=2700081 RepID=UPI0003A86243|nr:YgzB family protein [Virgibacillus sp. MSP4-1]QHS24321.1 YgzB family protein [Virgibacillus sp. MSP4-1]